MEAVFRSGSREKCFFLKKNFHHPLKLWFGEGEKEKKEKKNCHFLESCNLKGIDCITENLKDDFFSYNFFFNN